MRKVKRFYVRLYIKNLRVSDKYKKLFNYPVHPANGQYEANKRLYDRTKRGLK